MAEPLLKDRFVNRSGGFLGAVVRAPGSQTGFKGVALYPGQEVDLDEEEQAATANAPRDPRANPLANGQLELVAEKMNFKGRRPLRPDSHLQTADPARPETWSEEQRSNASVPEISAEALAAQAETGMDIDPGKQPAVGAYSPFEEQGTPENALKQTAPIGGQAIDGSVMNPSGGEPAAEKSPDSLAGAIIEEGAEVLGPADRVGHVPGAGSRTPQIAQPGELAGHDRGPRPRVTTTP